MAGQIATRASDPIIMTSPDGGLQAELSVTAGGELRYSLKSGGTTILMPSPMGITIDGIDLGNDVLLIEASDPALTNRNYTKFGTSSTATDQHQRYRITAKRNGSGDDTLAMEIRIFNGAFALRYFIPGNVERVVSGEKTAWDLPPGSEIWFQGDALTHRGEYTSAMIGSVSATAGGPVAVTLPDHSGYLLLSEAALFEHSGMACSIEGNGSNRISCAFPHDASWKKPGGFATPWRVTLHASDLDDLVNSDVFGNLCPLPKALSLPGGAKSPWIVPGRMLGHQRSNPKVPATFDSYISTIEHAHALGFEYILIDEGWEDSFATPEKNHWDRLAMLCAYARSNGRNVGVWVTKRWEDIANQEYRGDFFFRTKIMGAVGIKLDNVQSESFETLQTYREAMIEAGVFQLMIHMGDSGKSTGEHRTFPHELSRGGIRGLQQTHEGSPPVNARHNAILPFSRLIPGPGDCQPVTFDETKLGATTYAHQLATAGLFTSPLTHWADEPERYLAQHNALDIIHELPTTWDETRVLDISKPGEIAAMARRTGKRWFLFIINGSEISGITFPQLSLSFLGNRIYDSIQLSDLTQSSMQRSERSAITQSSTLSINLLPGGGFVALFEPRPDLTAPETDTDLDGIPDLHDCAPKDPSFSSPHTFYTDVDRDHYGDRFKPVRTNTNVPLPPLVSWGNDPNDYTMESYPEVVPKGERVLGLDCLQTDSSELWQPGPLNELGAEVAPIRLTWGDYESANGAFNGPDADKLKVLLSTYRASGIRPALTISPFRQGLPHFPSDLQARIEGGLLDMQSQEVTERFAEWLTELWETAGVGLHSLQIGEPLHLTHSALQDAAFWSGYLVFFQVAKSHAETLWGQELVVLSSTSHDSLIDETTGPLFQGFMNTGDVVGITFQPRLLSYEIIEPEHLSYTLESVMAYYPGRSFHLIDVAYPSSPGVFSSETKQSQAMKALFQVWDSHAATIPYVSISQLFDPPDGPVQTKIERYYSSLGLRNHDNTAKAAYKTLRNLAFERGWWRIPSAPTRPFLMGFSQTQYDSSETLEQRQQVLDWILPKFIENSDISSIQIDMGVPWVEALEDDLSTQSPPYHQQVLNEWSSLKASVPSGQPLVVAISPIGNPRSHISAYWGEAEGYRFVKGGFSGPEFVRVPDGTIRADGLRYPPAPWDTLPFNSQQVKEAYLKYCIRVIEYFKPDYLLTTLEASACLIEDRERYGELVELMRFIYESLKSYPQYAKIPQVISISTTSFIKDEYGIPYKYDEQVEGVFEDQIEGLSKLLPCMDMIGLSNYPHFGKYNGYTVNASMYDSLFESIALAGGAGKPVVISENGYSADSYQIIERPFPCTPEKQDAYLKNLLYSLQKTEHPVEYIINWAIRDNDRLWQRSYDQAVSTNDATAILFATFNQFFRDIGLYDGEGSADRPALARWKQVLDTPVVPKHLMADYPHFMSWALRHFPEEPRFSNLEPGQPWSPLNDIDGDSRSNLIEYLCDTDPRHSTPANPLALYTDSQGSWIELRLNTRALDIRSNVQVSSQLGNDWSIMAGSPEIVTGPDENGIAVVRIRVPDGSGDRKFFRLQASFKPMTSGE